jgi:hypothetical protein
MSDDPNWALEPGDTIVRKELHRQYGGRKQGGMARWNLETRAAVITNLEIGGSRLPEKYFATPIPP